MLKSCHPEQVAVTPRKLKADDQTRPPPVVFSLPPSVCSEIRGAQRLFVLRGLGFRVGRAGGRRRPVLELEHVPALRQQTLVENEGHQPRDQEDGQHGGDHDSSTEGEVLGHLPLFVQPTSWVLDDGREAEERLAAQHPQHDSHHQAHSSSVAVGHLEKEDADQLREHDGVGHVHAHEPEDQDAAVQEGETSSGQTHSHHGDPDHPLHLTVRSLMERQASGAGVTSRQMLPH